MKPPCTVLVSGTLEGMGRQAICKILAERDLGVPSGSYSQFMVVETLEDIPDGIYRVHFEGYSCSTRKLDGLWLSQNVQQGEHQIPAAPQDRLSE